jgi:hypothetical protein
VKQELAKEGALASDWPMQTPAGMSTPNPFTLDVDPGRLNVRAEITMLMAGELSRSYISALAVLRGPHRWSTKHRRLPFHNQLGDLHAEYHQA